jgi:hypothetical protein
MDKAKRKVIQASILLIMAFIMVDPPVIGLLRGREFVFSVNNVIAIVVFTVALVLFFSLRRK